MLIERLIYSTSSDFILVNGGISKFETYLIGDIAIVLYKK